MKLLLSLCFLPIINRHQKWKSKCEENKEGKEGRNKEREKKEAITCIYVFLLPASYFPSRFLLCFSLPRSRFPYQSLSPSHLSIFLPPPSPLPYFPSTSSTLTHPLSSLSFPPTPSLNPPGARPSDRFLSGPAMTETTELMP